MLWGLNGTDLFCFAPVSVNFKTVSYGNLFPLMSWLSKTLHPSATTLTPHSFKPTVDLQSEGLPTTCLEHGPTLTRFTTVQTGLQKHMNKWEQYGSIDMYFTSVRRVLSVGTSISISAYWHKTRNVTMWSNTAKWLFTHCLVPKGGHRPECPRADWSHPRRHPRKEHYAGRSPGWTAVHQAHRFRHGRADLWCRARRKSSDLLVQVSRDPPRPALLSSHRRVVAGGHHGLDDLRMSAFPRTWVLWSGQFLHLFIYILYVFIWFIYSLHWWVVTKYKNFVVVFLLLGTFYFYSPHLYRS